jgi:ATP-dependent DNA helicase RecG
MPWQGQWQVGLMAPTEILAEQHYLNFSTWFTALGFKVAWLSGKQGTKERNAALAMIANGEAQVIVGTHALFQDSVQFARLGLVIIDEQHRFGVDQRLALRQKGEQWGHVSASIDYDRHPYSAYLSHECVW